MTSVQPYVSVVGPSDAPPECLELAREVGRLLAKAGAVVITGGLGGVMAAASSGARSAGGSTVGLLPGASRSAANPDVAIALTTRLGEARNVVVVSSADAVISVGCSWGTLSEIALACRIGVPVIGLRSWRLVDHDGRPITDAPQEASDAADAVARALRAGRSGNEL